MKRKGWGICLAALLLGVLLLLGCADRLQDGMTVEVLDVGQSDCTLITVGETVLMIDAATVTERAVVQAALDRHGIEHIDYLLLTHFHEDHIGNARMVLETYTVGALLVPPVETGELDQRLVIDTAAQASFCSSLSPPAINTSITAPSKE